MYMDSMKLRGLCIEENWCDQMDYRKYNLLFNLGRSLKDAQLQEDRFRIWNRMREMIFWNSSKFEDLQEEASCNNCDAKWIENHTNIGTLLSTIII